MDKVHPQDAKHSCDALQGALRKVEDNIGNLFSDIQALKDGHYHQSEQMHRRYTAYLGALLFTHSNFFLTIPITFFYNI